MIRAMSIGWAMVLALLFAAACGGGAAPREPTPDPRTPETTPTQEANEGTPESAPPVLRAAYVNLGSPITVDTEDTVAAETYAERLQMIVEELNELEADIIAVSEATWAPDLPNSSWAMLASDLGMEAQFARANPWYPGLTQEESDAVVDLVGFEEGEAILSRYPIRRGTRIELNPRVSENEGRIVFHVVVRIPGIGDTNVYITRLGGDADARTEQAADLENVIEETREDRPSLVLGELGLPPDSAAVESLTSGDLHDLHVAAGQDANLPTCCREEVVFNVPPEGEAGENEDTPEGEPSPNEEPRPGDAGTPTPFPEAEPVTARTSYIFADSWDAAEFQLFANEPAERPDGSRLYASDHNGIFAVISLENWRQGASGP